MKEAAIFMLCQLAGKEATGANFKKIAEAAGVELDEDAAKALIADMKEKNLEEVLAAGAEKMKDMGAGGRRRENEGYGCWRRWRWRRRWRRWRRRWRCPGRGGKEGVVRGECRHGWNRWWR